MEEDFEEYDIEDIKKLVKRFEQGITSGKTNYFDIEEFEEIIDFYDSSQNTNRLEIAIQTANEIHPDHISFKIRLAQRYSANKRYNKSIELLEELVGIEPNNFLIRQTLAHVYSRIKKHEKAIECYQETLKMGAVAGENF